MDGVSEAMLGAGIVFLPGPTNTLLACASGIYGLRKAAQFALSALIAYVVALSIFLIMVRPVIAALPHASVVFAVGCSVVLLLLARQLWFHRGQHSGNTQPISNFKIVIATLLNPKVLVLGLILSPTDQTTTMVGTAAGVRYLIIGGMCMAALATWTLLGSLLPAELKGEKSTIKRASAIALVGFAVVLLGSVVRPFVAQQGWH